MRTRKPQKIDGLQSAKWQFVEFFPVTEDSKNYVQIHAFYFICLSF